MLVLQHENPIWLDVCYVKHKETKASLFYQIYNIASLDDDNVKLGDINSKVHKWLKSLQSTSTTSSMINTRIWRYGVMIE